MPRLWSQTIDAHRREVVEAILDTTADLVARHGLRAVTMSKVAEETGIARATLYKYFPGVEAIIVAWHERQVDRHLHLLADIAAASPDDHERLRAVLETYGLIVYEHRDNEIAALGHGGEHMSRARHELATFVSRLLADAAASGAIRRDMAPDELATYCLAALGAATRLDSKAAVRRLVGVTLAGLAPA